MAAYYKLYVLLFVFMNCFKPPSMLANSEIMFVVEPKADKSCYEQDDKGTLTTTVSIQGLPASVPSDQFTIAWSSNPNEDGTTWVFYGINCISSSIRDPNCWFATVVCDENVFYLKIEVKDTTFQDQTAGLYAFVIDRTTDMIVARSSATAHFNVRRDCLLPIPTDNIHVSPTKETDSNSSTSSTNCTCMCSPTPPPSVGDLSQKWSILTSDVEKIISLYITGQYLEAAFTWTFVWALIHFVYIVFRTMNDEEIQLFFPDVRVYDLIMEWF